MYHIALYENGHFCSYIGGAVATLEDAAESLKTLAEAVDAEEVKNYLGYKFNRCGTPCALIILDRWDLPINNTED